MSLAYYASPIDFNQNEKLEQKRKNSKNNKLNLDVLKKLAQPKESEMQEIHENANKDIKEENDSILSDFYEKEVKDDASYQRNVTMNKDYLMSNNLHANKINHAALFGTTSEFTSNHELLSKLNHIIQMFEEQKEIKTNQKNEEVVMYCFLGIFVIYVLDSFVYVGQYKR
tara:strand:- start:2877 stop:3386 length:510 start_codon:yes stop_codon:yes gene_type:complete